MTRLSVFRPAFRSARLSAGVLVALGCISAAAPGQAQTRYDADCRPLPMPGMMMQPQPPSEACLQFRAQQRRESEAERARQRARAEAAARARAEQLAVDQAKCDMAKSGDVRATLDADPSVLGRGAQIMDMTEPAFVRDACRNEILTNRGIMDSVITFQEFNGKQYIRVKVTRRPGS